MMLVQLFPLYCTVVGLLAIAFNLLFLVVTRLRRVEGFQEVLVFMRNIAVGYGLCALMIILLAPETRIIPPSSHVSIVHGALATIPLDSSTLAALSTLGLSAYLYTVLSFCLMFLYRYNVTAQTSMMSTLFGQRNIKVYLAVSGAFSAIIAGMLFYSRVDEAYLFDRLNGSLALSIDQHHPLPTSHQLRASNATGTAMSNQYSVQLDPYATSNSTVESTSSLSSQTSDSANFNIYGTDYVRNPMFLLSMGLYFGTFVVCTAMIVILSLVIVCKLRGRQESMSDKSQVEHQKLTNVLMLVAYLPIVLSTIAGGNYVLGALLQKTLHPVQAYLSTLVMAPLPLLFPLANLLLIPELRESMVEFLLLRNCTPAQRNKLEQERQKRDEKRQGRQKKEEDGQLSEIQVEALRIMS